jgi:hypothetical protein
MFFLPETTPTVLLFQNRVPNGFCEPKIDRSATVARIAHRPILLFFNKWLLIQTPSRAWAPCGQCLDFSDRHDYPGCRLTLHRAGELMRGLRSAARRHEATSSESVIPSAAKRLHVETSRQAASREHLSHFRDRYRCSGSPATGPASTSSAKTKNPLASSGGTRAAGCPWGDLFGRFFGPGETL